MNNLHIETLDTTLRDGMQGEGITFSVEDKLALCRILDRLGITYIEGGVAGANPKDDEFFRRAKTELDLKNSILTAFGSTRRKNTVASEDTGVLALADAGTKAVTIFGKCWKLHVAEILNTTPDENLNMIYDTISYLVNCGKEVIFDAEHFFDGYKNDPEYALSTLKSAANAGASILVLCDTNGGTFCDEIYQIASDVVNLFPDTRIGIHCHNDSGMATASSTLAVKAGATHIQGTFLGIGERCGNAQLSTIIPGLQLKKGYRLLPDDSIKNLTSAAREIAEICNISIKKYEPYIGTSAFAHKAGMHTDAVLKNPVSFEHIPPESVGSERRFLMSEIAGRGAVLVKAGSILRNIDKNSPEADLIIEKVKEMEGHGYQYEGAESSFELLVKRCTGQYHPYFELINYKTIEESPYEEFSTTATIKIKVGDRVQLSAAEGHGPVHALDKALRSAIEIFYPCLKGIKLIDYKVRVMDSNAATAAKVRVLISSTDGKKIWTTVGCSNDIIEASWIALVDSIEYKLSLEEGISPLN